MDTYAKSAPRDVFLHIASAILLYVSVGSFLTLWFSYVDALIPDPLNPAFLGAGSFSFLLAMLIVIFPLYCWVSYVLYRDRKRMPEKGELGIRKWLVYLTIFLAGALIAGDCIALISTFLSGELSARFLLKVAALLLTAGAVFGYSLYDLKRNADEFSFAARVFTGVVGVVVLATIILGFFLGGSPFAQRKLRLDAQRVERLQIIQNQVVNYWSAKNTLPNALEDLRDSISGFAPPTDPETGMPFEYRKTGNLAFEVCANFLLAASQENPKMAVPVMPYFMGGATHWGHGAGRACFSRTIDPDLYKQPVR